MLTMDTTICPTYDHPTIINHDDGAYLSCAQGQIKIGPTTIGYLAYEKIISFQAQAQEFTPRELVS